MHPPFHDMKLRARLRAEQKTWSSGCHYPGWERDHATGGAEPFMRKSFLNREKANRSSIQYRLMLVEFLVVVLPLIALVYVLYDRRVTFETSHLWIVALILVLVLCGMLILRQIINRILSVVVMVRPTEAGVVQATLRDDLSEIREIEQAFGGLVNRLEKTTADLNRRSAEFLALKEIVDVAKTSLDLHNLQELTLDKVMSVTGARIASFLTVDPSRNRFRIAATRGIAASPQQDIDLPLADSPARLAVSEKKAVIVEDIEADPRIGRPNNPRYGSPSFICLPILAGSEVSAVINLAGKPAGEVFSEDDEKITSIMLREIKFAFENARLHLQIKEQLKQIEEKNAALQEEIEQRRKLASRLNECEDQLKGMASDRAPGLAAATRPEGQAAPPAGGRTGGEGTPKERGTILLVDDEDVILSVARDMLESLGYRVMTASSGGDALDVYRRCAGGVDLIILDVTMPGIGGETMKGFRAVDPQVRVLLSSGYGSGGFLQEGMNEGALGFIQKPFRLDDLSRRVREILEGRSKPAGSL